MPKAIRYLLWASVLLAACGSGAVKPLELEASDMCSFCRMAISERRFAAEIIDQDDNALKFDDIGCMLHYQQAAGDKLKPAAVFVTDVDARQWLPAVDAYFVRSASVKTPMGSGIVAYSNAEKAGSEAVRYDQLRSGQK
jgi:copper chaperone NosL